VLAVAAQLEAATGEPTALAETATLQPGI
jgi:hypothetical protein